VTWNVAGRVRSVPEQAAALAQRPADIVALQEVRASALRAWTAALHEMGFADVRSAPLDHPDRSERRLAVLVATRHGDMQVLPSLPLPWPERHLGVLAPLDGDVVEVHALHAPISAKADQVKVRTLEAMAAALAPPRPVPTILAGDLNTPQYESREGAVQSFARTRSGRVREHLGERHDAAELGIVVGLLEHGYVDAFRAVHGYGARDRSWMYANRKMGYRLDHVLARGLEPIASGYEHGWREAGLSDHSGMWAELRRRRDVRCVTRLTGADDRGP
jgi:endonuclease/exonuclease/phosphatase family metal-dependent hydrolase